MKAFLIDSWVAALLMACLAIPAHARRPHVMDATLPTGTIVGLEPDHPVMTVQTSVSGHYLIVQGELAPAPYAVTDTTQSYTLCQSRAATCRKFDAHLPTNHVVNGRFEIYARLKGQLDWITLVKRETNARFADTYEEFGGFAADPYFASANCAVNSHDETAWEVRNWTGQPVEFQLRIPTQVCAAIDQGQEEAD